MTPYFRPFPWIQYMFCALQLYKWGFQYVENLTWVYLDANNTILTLPSAYAQKSHLTLFIFRREGNAQCCLTRTSDYNSVHGN